MDDRVSSLAEITTFHIPRQDSELTNRGFEQMCVFTPSGTNGCPEQKNKFDVLSVLEKSSHHPLVGSTGADARLKP
jgi:hypothetical protein